MRAILANLNHCAVPYLSRAAVNLCWYDYIHRTYINLLLYILRIIKVKTLSLTKSSAQCLDISESHNKEELL